MVQRTDLIAQGAEATIYCDGTTIIKHRLPKAYRHPIVDMDLRKIRTRREAKILTELARIEFPSPRIMAIDDKEMILRMDLIPGQKLRNVLDQDHRGFAWEIGRKVAALHQNNIVHGDLTTSNMIVHEAAQEIYFIDFGLSQFSERAEDKAVDLHLLQRALDSKHSIVAKECFAAVLREYQKSYANATAVLERLRAVELRGRNRAKKGS
ncbi:Kae1-associated serine/threonine protein kinase [Candidatus Woesearchaeota archaeon]|nr:Kae1-associated serine/threonine protein kinase [Candidatus Woesearchaeota archaeon]